MGAALTRTVRFRAVHRLARPDWSDEENRRRFGWTVDPHGHHYTCAVTVAGPIDPRLGMVIDLSLFDRLLHAEIVARLDGKSIPDEVADFGDLPPTCEAIASDLFRRLERRLPAGVRLARVRVAEDPTLEAEVTGDA